MSDELEMSGELAGVDLQRGGDREGREMGGETDFQIIIDVEICGVRGILCLFRDSKDGLDLSGVHVRQQSPYQLLRVLQHTSHCTCDDTSTCVTSTCKPCTGTR